MKKLAYSNRWILSKQKGVILKQNQKTSTSIAKKKIKQVSKQTKTMYNKDGGCLEEFNNSLDMCEERTLSLRICY